ncbi:hypothetical protein BDV29DRAFT_162097 [Aspergillus leporis]|uniref:Thiamine pyrophosphate enzyme N-terminal TPP-binding domain-containing protein n=1 Tax=Aspergillus leporis TaxID=41062 RepID=A0A5N5WJL4_9EURO|nr:hypothetical protein BDV29DRAFT_162097 [Aspergillus leporis]
MTESGRKGRRTLTTAAEGFFEELTQAGVTHCFVNLGSDYPAMLDAMIKAKQGAIRRILLCGCRFTSRQESSLGSLTSSLARRNVALSAALRYAQVKGHPQCVIAHVGCGNLAMGQSMHNASVSRVPVLCFTSLSPFAQNGELLGVQDRIHSVVTGRPRSGSDYPPV